ncbi:hypothetical protein AB0F88_18335 [Streptosporangium sp. NPDC023963]|uniref:hypothetical protein n=1 Tax=Streptosporangium sp. NPDC023963 TaxID=3155608 RepID=UPI0034399246
MKIGLALLLAVTAAVGAGCGDHDDTAFLRAQEECYEKDRRESNRLAEETGPLLAPHVRSTLEAGSGCDSVLEGGAWITYDLDPGVSPRAALKKFHSAGWADLPQPIEHCADLCVAGVGKKVGDRDIVVTVQEFDGGPRVLEALFMDKG